MVLRMNMYRVLLAAIVCVLAVNLPPVVSVTVEELQARLDKFEETMNTVTYQMMMQQFAQEEYNRGEGDSGIHNMRLSKVGTNDYHAAAFSDENKVSAVHNHANNIRTVGMGELQLSMNGVHFRTRHNDYRLYKPSTTSQEYGAVEDIEFPAVPEAVTSKETIEEEIEEMRLWFKAFKDQNSTVRDYRQYFKPVMCYMEGAWSTVTEEISEPFESDRHFLKGRTWKELFEQVRFQAYNGGKDVLENFAYLPTGMMGVNEDGSPVIAQWIYRILCHEVTVDVPLKSMKVVDDLLHRLPTDTQYAHLDSSSRGARFKIAHKLDVNYPKNSRYSYWMGMDQIMQEIPGLNNYPASFTDLKDGEPILNLLDEISDLNVGYYHRVYKMASSDAMGLRKVNRAFNDHSIYMAKTNHSNIASMSFTACDDEGNNCQTTTERWTYAIPLELIYLTPLHRWNPHNIEYWGDKGKSPLASSVWKHLDPSKPNRNGGLDKDSAFNGTHSKIYYRTPIEFFTGGEIQTDPADTTKDFVGVLDGEGNPQKVTASGVRIFSPDIFDVGVVRLRYPVMPVYAEGSSTWKELKALQDIVMEPVRYNSMLREEDSITGDVSNVDDPIVRNLETGVGGLNMSVGAHTHTMVLRQSQLEKLMNGDRVTVESSEKNSHMHKLRISYVDEKFKIHRCDSMPTCWDHHPTELSATVSQKRELLEKALENLLRKAIKNLRD